MISREDIIKMLVELQNNPQDYDCDELSNMGYKLEEYLMQPPKLDSNVEEAIERLSKVRWYNNALEDSFSLEFKTIKQALRQGEEYKNHYELYFKLAKEYQSTINAIEEVVNSMPNLVECVFSDETMENYKKLVPNGYESVRIVNQNAKLYFKYFKKFKQILEAQNEKTD